METVTIKSREEFKSLILTEETKNLLNRLNISRNWLGYKFLVTAIPFAISKELLEQKIVLKEIYKFVAKHHKTTPQKVECAIRYLHENTNIAIDLGFEDGKTCNTQLILKMCDLVEKQIC